jgi:putative DNA methylase
MSHPIKSPRKLIEVALPLDAINAEAARSKRKAPGGYPTTFHCWWAQRPLAAARAIVFAQLVNDPGYQQGSGFRYGRNKKEAAIERRRLFKILEDLVLWENSTNEAVLDAAREEIRRSWREVCALNKDHPQAIELFDPEKLPALHDPFAGGGAIPLEAQRLGLETYASDLNPVAVLINKALIEIPPKFAGRAPIGRVRAHDVEEALGLSGAWPGATGLGEDVRRYGAWMRSEAHRRIGELYPPIEIRPEMARERPELKPLVGKKLEVIAWLWARTVKSPNPAFSNVDVPLVATFILSSKEGKEVYVEPVVNGDSYSFSVRTGSPPEAAGAGTKAAGRGSAFKCLVSNAAISGDYIKTEGQAKRMSTRLMAIVAKGPRGRVYLSPTQDQLKVALSARPNWKPDVTISGSTQYLGVQPYGMTKFSDIFTDRQLVALTTFSDLLSEARELVKQDALAAGMDAGENGLEAGGTGAAAYSEAICTYLAFGVDRMLDYGSSISTWRPKDNAMRSTMSRQAIPMSWDFAEGSPFGSSSSGFTESVGVVTRVLDFLPASLNAHAVQMDAQTQSLSRNRVVSTDPPYYDNIPYADLSDYFYIWLRRSLRQVFPNLFSTVTVPKSEELVAFAYRHENGKAGAEQFFLEGMTKAMHRLAEQAHPAFSVTIYYAFKQSESEDAGGTSSTGWETFLDAVLRAGLAVTGTWPVRTEGDNRQRGNKSNALASSIVLVCRKRELDAPTVSRRDFMRELNTVLPEALDEMTKGVDGEHSPVAPVDLSQAMIGPGMAVFSKYAAVLEADGSSMGVRTALQLINRFLAEDDFEPDTQFCLHWFEQHAWSEGAFGDADTLSRGKGTSVDGMRLAGILHSGGGKVRLLKWAEYPSDWDPRGDVRLPVWEALHQLIRALKQGGESAAGARLASLGGKAEAVRQLAYRLYTLCERLGNAEDARGYNELITSWNGIESAAGSLPTMEPQGELFG